MFNALLFPCRQTYIFLSCDLLFGQIGLQSCSFKLDVLHVLLNQIKFVWYCQDIQYTLQANEMTLCIDILFEVWKRSERNKMFMSRVEPRKEIVR